MVKQDSLLTKIAFLGISFVLTSAYAINGALPQMTEALHISSTEAQVLATTPSITVTIFVLLSSFIAAKLGDKNTIILGVTLVGIAGMIPFFYRFICDHFSITNGVRCWIWYFQLTGSVHDCCDVQRKNTFFDAWIPCSC